MTPVPYPEISDLFIYLFIYTEISWIKNRLKKSVKDILAEGWRNCSSAQTPYRGLGSEFSELLFIYLFIFVKDILAEDWRNYF